MDLSNFFAGGFDSIGRRLLRGLQRGLPQACALCAANAGDALLCGGCIGSLPCIEGACPACGLPSAAVESPLATPALCGTCLARPPPFAATVAAWTYEFPVDRLLQAFKYGGTLALAEPLADALTAAVRRRDDLRTDAVVPLPLAPARQRRRGFNQAHEIARRVAVSLRLPLGRVSGRGARYVVEETIEIVEDLRRVLNSRHAR